MKKVKLLQSHSSPNKIGMGDFYGTGIKSKIGKSVDIYPVDYTPTSDKKMGKPPKSTA
jgi:hypothetical protein